MQQIRSSGAGILLAFALIGSMGFFQPSPVSAQPDPIGVASIQPNQVSNDLDNPVTITGTGFSNTGGLPQVFLGDVALQDVAWVSDSTLTALIPWGISAGSYALRVVNPDGGEDSLVSGVSVAEGIGQWSSGDLFGGPIDAVAPVASQPGWLYAYSTHASALYRSTDYGATWTTQGHPFNGQFLTVDPKDANTLFVGNARSTDSGVTWQGMFDQWPGTDQYPGWYTWVFPHPTVAGTIFVATANIPATGNSAAGLLRSTDDGKTWQKVQTGIAAGDESVTAMEFSPDDPQTIYIGTRDGNLYKSTDGGDHWGDAQHLLDSIGILKINPFNHAQLWVTTQFQVTPTARILKVNLSDNYSHADVWGAHPDYYPTSLGFISANSAYMATRWDKVWTTIDGGGLWTDITPADGKAGNSLALDPWDTTHQTFYTADEQYGVQKTTNGGMTWLPMRDGLRAMTPDRLVVDPTNPNRVYAKIVANGWPGIFISENGGHDWAFSALKNGERPQPSALIANHTRVFVGTHGTGPGLYYSPDSGTTWTFVDVDPTLLHSEYFYMPWAIQADPLHDQTLLMTVVIGNRLITTDHYFSEIYRSTDNGDTWQPIGLEAQIGHPVYNLTSLAFDPHDSQIVYADGSEEVLKSTDGGLTWTVVSANMGNFNAEILVEPVAPYRVFLGNQVSADGGLTWKGMDTPMGVAQMAFAPGTDTVYIASNGMARSTDGGKTWQVKDGGVSAARITALAVAQVDERTIVYAGTPGGDAAVSGGVVSRIAAQSGAALEAGIYRLTEVKYGIFLPVVKH
jgi:photosystem II stability/assembly factor-like uncharacterized protein